MSAHAHQTAIDEQNLAIVIPWRLNRPLKLKPGEVVILSNPEDRYPVNYPLLWKAWKAINPYWREVLKHD